MVSDPNYNQRVLGLHFDGADNSTVFTDNSPTPKTVTANGNAKIVGNMGVFDGSGDYLSVANHADFGFGTGRFAFGAYINPTAISGVDRALFDFRQAFAANNLVFFIDNTTGGRLAIWDGTTKYGSTGSVVALNTRQHVEVDYDGTTIYCFLDGVLQFSAAFSTDLGASKPLGIGGSTVSGNEGSSPFAGTIDEAYIWKGVALHTSNFTPPTLPYADGNESLSGIISAASGSSTASILGVIPNAAVVSAVSGSSLASIIGNIPNVAVINAISGSSTANIIGNIPNVGTISALSGSSTASIIGGLTGQTIIKPQIIGYKYLATIEDTAAFEIPISSINGTVRSSGSVTLSAVCPDGVGYGNIVLAQRSGVLRIKSFEYYSDGTVSQTENLTLRNLDITYSRGANSYSITIQGTATITFPTLPRTLFVTGVQYETLQSNGALRIRCDLDKDVKPNDIVVMPNGNRMTVGQVQYIVGQNSKSMELSELI